VAKATGASRPPTEETQKVMAVLEVDVINLNALPQPGGMKRVLSIIDGFSLYSAQRPMRNETAETVSRSMAEFLEAVIERHGPWTHSCVLQVDNAFQKEFETQMRNWAQSKGVPLQVRRGQAYVSNSQSRVENVNREWRAATRKMLMAQGASAKNWYTNGAWREVNGTLNLRPREALGWMDSTTVWEAGWAEMKNQATPQQERVLETVRALQQKRARMRRGPGANAARALPQGSYVRLGVGKYRAGRKSIRGNEEKMGVGGVRAWQADVHQITTVRPPSQSGAPPAYLLDGAKMSTGGTWVAHDELARTWFPESELQDAPTAIAKADRDYQVDQEVRDAGGNVERTYFRGYALPED
jgi:hypothetical protein